MGNSRVDAGEQETEIDTEASELLQMWCNSRRYSEIVKFLYASLGDALLLPIESLVERMQAASRHHCDFSDIPLLIEECLLALDDWCAGRLLPTLHRGYVVACPREISVAQRVLERNITITNCIGFALLSMFQESLDDPKYRQRLFSHLDSLLQAPPLSRRLHAAIAESRSKLDWLSKCM
jgi:hypothetical protein